MTLLSKCVATAIMAAALAVPVSAQPIQGAGSTFAAPVIAKWSHAYRLARADGGDYMPHDSGIDYEPVGSLAGVLRLGQPEVDFAATEAPFPTEEIRRRNLVQFPFVIGAIVPIFNLPGLGAGSLRLTGALLADIYLGKVKQWDDPAVRAANPGVTMPAATITVVRRSDGSGTTFNWTLYLSDASAEWKAKLGADTVIAWPTGIGAEGNQGVARRVQQTVGAIGYVEYGVVARAGLSYALVENKAGRYVSPDRASISAAAAGAEWSGSRDFHWVLTNAPGADSYPITAATFAVMSRERSRARILRTLDFFRLGLEKGAADAAALGFAPLPPALVGKVTAYWQERLGAGH